MSRIHEQRRQLRPTCVLGQRSRSVNGRPDSFHRKSRRQDHRAIGRAIDRQIEGVIDRSAQATHGIGVGIHKLAQRATIGKWHESRGKEQSLMSTSARQSLRPSPGHR